MISFADKFLILLQVSIDELCNPNTSPITET